MYKKLLMTPGPTNVPKRVLNKMSEDVLHHRTKEFSNLFCEFNERLKYVFQTKNPVLTFPCSGTGGLESAILNSFSKGDKVLAISIGNFGDRFITISKLYGLDVDEINIPLGNCVTLDEIKNKLKNYHKAVILTHNETSTAAVNPIKEIGLFLKNKNKLFIVDAVSSLGGMEIKMDDWNIDILITASQKALMSPPGLAFVGVSEYALECFKKSTLPKFYFDFLNAKKYMDKKDPQNPYTPAVSLINATNEALKMIQEEGLYNVYKRHEFLANKVRNECIKMGLELFTNKNCLSNTVTAIKFKEEGKSSFIKNEMEKQYNIIIAGGQGVTKNKIIRIGHLGCINEEMVDKTLYALKKLL